MQIQTDRALIPANKAVTRYLTITVNAPERESRTDRASTAVSLVLDRSGSMAGTKIAMARQAVDHAIQLLTDRDELAVVVYDDNVDVVLDRTAATRDAKATATRRLAAIEARGCTDLAGGWSKGAEYAPARVLLLTDGLANRGVTDPDALAAKAAEFKARGIATSTFGVGADFDETLLARLATEGGGHFYYIENPRQIPDLLTSELGETLEVVAHDACLEIKYGDGVNAAPLNEFPVELGAAGIRIKLGDLVSGQELTLVVALTCKARPKGAEAHIDCRVIDRDAALFPGAMRVAWHAADAASDESQPMNLTVCLAAAGVLAARARREALELNRRGGFDDATALLKRAAEATRAIAPGNAAVEAVADSLVQEVVEYSQLLRVDDRKSRHYASYQVLHERGPEGKARRRTAEK